MKILITGASSGIGRAIAMLYARDRHDLILVGRDEERLNEAKKEAQSAGAASVTAVPLDLTVRENCLLLSERFSDADVLINNAGFGDFGAFCETSLDKELKMIDTNVKAMHILFKLFLLSMTKRNSGQILNVASIAGFMPGPLMATYYATKAYVVRLSEGVRKELKKAGSAVGVSILCPGPVRTGFEKTANIGFNFYGNDVDKVARYAYKKFGKRKFCIVPVLPVRMSRFFLKILPSPVIASLIYAVQSKRKGKR